MVMLTMIQIKLTNKGIEIIRFLPFIVFKDKGGWILNTNLNPPTPFERRSKCWKELKEQ